MKDGEKRLGADLSPAQELEYFARKDYCTRAVFTVKH